LIAGVLFLVDWAAGELLSLAQFPVPGLVGDLLLVEAGLLAVLGGLIEFSRSKGVYEFRRIALRSKEEFSTATHLEASRRAIVFFSAALTLFVLLIALALLE
jgi:hypothetical protein